MKYRLLIITLNYSNSFQAFMLSPVVAQPSTWSVVTRYGKPVNPPPRQHYLLIVVTDPVQAPAPLFHLLLLLFAPLLILLLDAFCLGSRSISVWRNVSRTRLVSCWWSCGVPSIPTILTQSKNWPPRGWPASLDCLKVCGWVWFGFMWFG